MRKKHMETKMIHNESCKNNETGSLTTPIYQTSTFSFASAQEGARRFAGEEEGYIYSRLGNPTVAQFEERMAALEGGEKDWLLHPVWQRFRLSLLHLRKPVTTLSAPMGFMDVRMVC